MCPPSIPPLLLLESPYGALRPVEGGSEQLKTEGRKPGSALIWVLDAGATEPDRNIVEQRPGGLALIVILPRVTDLANDPTIFHLIEACRPHGILPYHERLAERELAQVLKRPPGRSQRIGHRISGLARNQDRPRHGAPHSADHRQVRGSSLDQCSCQKHVPVPSRPRTPVLE